MELGDLKKAYGELAAKHKLPDFKELNENFEIDRIDKESDCLLHVIRKAMMDKIANAMNFLDMLLNPMNAPRVYLTYVKSMNAEDKKVVEGMYSSLSELVIDALSLEIEYSERGEAEMIKKIASKWEDVKTPFKQILESMKHPHAVEKKERSYFG